MLKIVVSASEVMGSLRIEKTGLHEISDLRKSFLEAGGFQFIHNKCHVYGWADVYVFREGKVKIGYGSVWGKDNRQDRDTIFEFYLIPGYHHQASSIFSSFAQLCGAPFMECQTNDTLLAGMMFEHAEDIHAQSVLFEDDTETRLSVPGVTFNKHPYTTNHPDDRGGYVLEGDKQVMATGGFLLNYNHPFADIYMDVKEEFRQRGLGSLMVQELKKEIYKIQRVPAARCNIKNTISRATLVKAGFRLCGYLLEGKIKNAGPLQTIHN
jgi:RimJ/RimL family protein N-acetyltransferase